VLGRENRNRFLSMGLFMILSIVFFSVTFGCQYLGNLQYVSPALAAWLPLLVFIPALPIILGRLQT
jgi:lipopolysaccharide export system permease protein